MNQSSPLPTFWRTGDRTTSIQVHNAKDAALVKRHFEGRRIAYSVTGNRLEVFQTTRSLESGDAWLLALLPNARRVWGSDGDNDNLPAQ